MKTIKRKTMLYKTGVEYGDYTMNHVLGCSHGCKYPCYAYLMKKRFGIISSYNDWIEPRLVSNTLELLETEIPKLKHKIKSVHLCFSTDPFMNGYQEISRMSINAIRMLNDANIKCVILTKGILPDELAMMSKENEYGISLVSLDESFRLKMEPGTASFKDRIDALKKLSEKGFKTWVSIEPYPTPNQISQSLQDILDEISFVDKIIFGKTNYSKDVSSFSNYKEFYNQCAKDVINFCESKNKLFHIKNGTLIE